MPWVTSGAAMNGRYYFRNLHNANSYMCSKYGDRTTNGHYRAYTKVDSSHDSHWFHFRLVWIKDEKCCSNAGATISWYNIMSETGYGTTNLDTQNLKHNLRHCYNVGTWNSTSADDEHRSCGFGWENAPGASEEALWGLFDDGSNVYRIVSYSSWKAKNVKDPGPASNGVHWLFSGAQVGSSAYQSLATWPYNYGSAGVNYWKWELTRVSGISSKYSNSWHNKSGIMVKINGTWKPCIPYVKVGGSWKQL